MLGLFVKATLCRHIGARVEFLAIFGMEDRRDIAIVAAFDIGEARVGETDVTPETGDARLDRVDPTTGTRWLLGVVGEVVVVEQEIGVECGSHGIDGLGVD